LLWRAMRRKWRGGLQHSIGNTPCSMSPNDFFCAFTAIQRMRHWPMTSGIRISMNGIRGEYISRVSRLLLSVWEHLSNYRPEHKNLQFNIRETFGWWVVAGTLSTQAVAIRTGQLTQSRSPGRCHSRLFPRRWRILCRATIFMIKQTGAMSA
jgi:hypothetical protein